MGCYNSKEYTCNICSSTIEDDIGICSLCKHAYNVKIKKLSITVDGQELVTPTNKITPTSSLIKTLNELKSISPSNSVKDISRLSSGRNSIINVSPKSDTTNSNKKACRRRTPHSNELKELLKKN